MSVRENYQFTDLHEKPLLVQEIMKLEERLNKEIGQRVTLIAYSPAGASGSANEETCRAGLDE